MPFPLLAALIPAIAGVAGSLIGAKASKKAAKQQVAGQQAAIATQERFLSPFATAGTEGLGAVQDFVNQGSDFSQTQAFKDITNASKAGGQFGSGNRATALTDYFATNFRPQRLNELGFLPQLGARAAGDLASGIGGLQQNIGTAQARGTIGQGNAFASGIGAFGGIDFASLLRKNNLGSQSFLNPSNPNFVGPPDPRG